MRRLSLFISMVCLTVFAGGADAQQWLDLKPNPDQGKVMLELPQLPVDMLYITALASGVGSNDLGLDRGQLGFTRLVRFERHGNRVLLLEPNLAYRAISDNAAERRAVTEAFAQSVIMGFEIQAGENGPSDRVAIDLTPLLISDATAVSSRIKAARQGNFKLDAGRSAVEFSAIRNFPKNTIIPAIVTFAAEDPGDWVASVTPTPSLLTVRVQHQFAALPEPGYRPRVHHPRAGYFPLSYKDYAAPLDRSIDRKLIYRHRLAPGDKLVYYVDGGAPEPVRSALLEGASWWSDAFAAAGFDGAYEVRVLPGNVDPLDIRYNVIQWVHRSTRGWSYGTGVFDPRNGEIIKGHVSLGSLRVRQDQMIAEALTAPFAAGDERSAAAQAMALARLRQLSAHEVGHTLGLIHNFAASFTGDRSVMDYPHPNLHLDDQGRIRIDQAYAEGVSEWDKLAIRYGYQPFDPAAEAAGLAAILQQAADRGLAFIADRDARVPGSAQVQAHLWDNGSNVLARLDELLEIRELALQRFSAAVLPQGTPLFEMERRLVPVYLLHRYQIEAAGKLVGGLQYDYAVRGDTNPTLEPLSGEQQNAAIDALIALLEPSQLALPSHLQYQIPPAAHGHAKDREFFSHATGAGFDPLAPARSAAQLVMNELLQPQRLARLYGQHALNAELPGLNAVLEPLFQQTVFGQRDLSGYRQAIHETVAWVMLESLQQVATASATSAAVRGRLLAAMDNLRRQLERRRDRLAKALRIEITRFLNRPLPADQSRQPVAVPPGSPIG